MRAGIAQGLSIYPCIYREPRCFGMVGVVWIHRRVRKYDRRLLAPIFLNEIVHKFIGNVQRVVADVEEPYFGAEYGCGAGSLFVTHLLYLVERHPFLFPQTLRLSPFAIRQAQYSHFMTARAV